VQHIVVIVFENKEYRAVLGNAQEPTFNSMARRYATLTRYYGVTHQSLPNYLALVSGSTHGITSDCTSCEVTGPMLADPLEQAGKMWKLYAEGLPDVRNLCHSMHDCSVRTGDSWLRAQLPPLRALPQTVVFVVFDEGTTNGRGGGHVRALALGTAVRPYSRSAVLTNHYGLLRTIEDAWGLSHLGRSAAAGPITGIWR
jgi:phosphatidylinositol-3-phosphatase